MKVSLLLCPLQTTISFAILVFRTCCWLSGHSEKLKVCLLLAVVFQFFLRFTISDFQMFVEFFFIFLVSLCLDQLASNHVLLA